MRSYATRTKQATCTGLPPRTRLPAGALSVRLVPRALQVIAAHLGGPGEEVNPDAWRAALRVFEHSYRRAPERTETEDTGADSVESSRLDSATRCAATSDRGTGSVERLLGRSVPRSTVNEALSTHARGSNPRFARMRRGAYIRRTE